MLDLSVVIPVHNEAENIARLVAEIDAVLAGQQFEIICVDDASTDASLAALTGLRDRHVTLRVLRHRTRAGQSAAIHTGVAAARAAWIVTLDGDGQNDPADIPALWQVAVDAPGALLGMVAGWRRQRHDAWLRKVSSRIANWVRSALLHDHTPDTGCGLKVMRREVYLALPFFDHQHRFLPALFQRAGWEVVSQPVSHRPRIAGRSKYGIHNRLWVGIVDLAGVWWLRRRGVNPDVEEPSDPMESTE